jgi:hypothetical protein
VSNLKIEGVKKKNRTMVTVLRYIWYFKRGENYGNKLDVGINFHGTSWRSEQLVNTGLKVTR